jgi:hypothetical protein
MWVEIGKYIVILFGIFIISAGGMMLIKPKTARSILRKAGSTNFINYAEITLRMLPAIGFILVANNSKFTDVFKLFGWFMLFTSLILYFVPRNLHHNFSNKCADLLKPLYFQFISPFAFLFGILIIYSVC